MRTLVDLVLFDLDGTISDPIVGIERSMNYSLSHFGHPPLKPAEVAVHIGPPLDEAFKSVTGITAALQIDAFVEKYRERYAEIGYSESVPYPGVSRALATLYEAGIPLGICTSKRTDFAERILEMFGLRSYFQFVNGGEIRVQKWQQIRALHSLGLVTQSSLMIGDRAVDLEAAHRNGLSAGGVLWGYGTEAELAAENPEYMFSSPNELPRLVKS
jgi:phosphoglycolate phosphatase